MIILELGTNDLANLSPEVVGFRNRGTRVFALEAFSVRVICVCHVIVESAAFVIQSANG